MWELDCEESWAPKNWCFWTVVLEKTLESPLDFREIQPVHSKGDQSWVFFGRNDAEAETPVFWPPRVKSWLIGKDSDAGRDLGQEEKGMTEDEMAGWHHWLDGHEFEWTLGVGDGQGDLECCDSGGRKELDTTEWLNWTELMLWCPSVGSCLVLLERVFAMTNALSWQNSVCRCPALFCTPRLNLPVTPDISWFPTFAFQRVYFTIDYLLREYISLLIIYWSPLKIWETFLVT